MGNSHVFNRQVERALPTLITTRQNAATALLFVYKHLAETVHVTCISHIQLTSHVLTTPRNICSSQPSLLVTASTLDIDEKQGC